MTAPARNYAAEAETIAKAAHAPFSAAHGPDAFATKCRAIAMRNEAWRRLTRRVWDTEHRLLSPREEGHEARMIAEIEAMIEETARVDATEAKLMARAA